jgi:hypothetical protein
MTCIKDKFRSIINGSPDSLMLRSKNAEDTFHHRRVAPHEDRDTLKYAKEAVDKYRNRDSLNIELFSLRPKDAKKLYRKRCLEAIETHENIGLILDMPEKDHFDFCVIRNDKAIICIKNQAQSYFFNDNCYVVAEDAFVHLDTGKDTHFQADQMSCAFFATKHTKSLLKNNGELFEKTIFDKENHQCYPHPEVFKYSQSDTFLENYKNVYSEKFEEFKNKSENAHLNHDGLNVKNFNAINTYRDSRFGKHRMLYFCAKHFHDSIRKSILENPH